MGSPHDLVADPASPFVAEFTGAELLLDGRVEECDDQGLAHIRLTTGAALWVRAPMGVGQGVRVHVCYRPEDILLSRVDMPFQGSARNRFRLRVSRLTPAQGLVRVTLAGEPPLIAIVTRASVAELGLQAGREVHAHLKAAALRAFRAADA
jgi:molybdopterin-binding protein